MGNDSGPAFPTHDRGGSVVNEHGVTYHQFSGDAGIPLRDYFAAKAMAAMMISTTNEDGWKMRVVFDERAKRAYEQADAMLAARAKGQ